jgi:HD-GYP domain-containing protein (c-di-GMP phosphodiesterase class II)
MQFAELSAVKHRLQLGAPLPFNVRNADKTLLLARGQRVESPEHLASLLERGALVDLTELMTPRDEIKKARRDQLPKLWSGALSKVADAMNMAPEPGFCDALIEASGPVQALIERDPDLAIFQVLQQGADVNTAYGAQRATQTAITSLLVANRLSWAPAQAERAFKVALTMNLSMLELQGTLASQAEPPTPEQRDQIRSHPTRSARMLEQAGVTDLEWINAVQHHHETEDGSGYPNGSNETGELAALVRRADVYTAKLAKRATRSAISADKASRQMFLQDPGHAITTAMIKEFGIYPPGSHVRLANGELGMVIERGPTITTPVVASLADERGNKLARPVRRDTAIKSQAVAGVLEPGVLKDPPTLDKILSVLG